MDLVYINKTLDEHQLQQGNIFSVSLEEYKEFYKALEGYDNTDKDCQALFKRVKNNNKPLCEFTKAIIELYNDKNNNKVLRTFEEKSFKSAKFDYCIFFCDVDISFKKENLTSRNLKIMCLEKLDADIQSQKNEIEAYLEQDLTGTGAAFLVKLSNLHKKEGKIDKAIVDLKKALQRAIKNSEFADIKVISVSLDELLEGNDKLYLINTLARANKIDRDKLNNVLAELERRNHENLDYSISILKLMLSNNPKSSKYRDNLISQYKIKYQDDPERCDFCIVSSGLKNAESTYLMQSIEKFEKIAKIKKDVFVKHNSFGLGRIIDVDKNLVTINFVKKKGHKMSIEMANKSLTLLDKNNIEVLKEWANREKLKNKFLTDTRWGLITLINSSDNTFKLMKMELVDEIMSEKEFNKFQEEAKEIIKNDNYISSVLNKNEEFEVRSTPISYEEKLYRQFRNETNIYEKVRITRTFLQTEGDQASESFQNILSYFFNIVKSKSVSKNYVTSYLFLKELERGKYKLDEIEKHIYHSEEEVFMSIDEEDKTPFYLDIKDAELKKDYIDCIKKYNKNYEELLIDFYSKQPNSYIAKIFAKAGEDKFDQKMMRRAINTCKSSPELLVFYLKSFSEDSKEWKEVISSPFELYNAELDVLGTFGKTQNAKFIANNLFDNKKMQNYIESEDQESSLTTLYWNIDRNINIDDMLKAKLKRQISDKCPSVLNKIQSDKEEEAGPKKLLCTAASYKAKQQEREDLINVEMPKNARDIAKARELGDLRENSEYQYAKDKQKILAANLASLEKEIANSHIVKQNEVDGSKVCFGVKVSILDNKTKKEEAFTILGPWESKAEENIISFTSPFAKKIYGKGKGEELKFELNDNNYDITIKNIEVLKIE